MYNIWYSYFTACLLAFGNVGYFYCCTLLNQDDFAKEE